MSDKNNGTHHAALTVPRGGLPAIHALIEGNEPVTVAFLGGSITEGAGASAADETSWRALTEMYLRELFENREIRCINAGVGGTDSTLGAHRLREHVLLDGNIDLLFVEFSVNDGDDREESLRGMEGIVRQCRRMSPQTDICFVYTGAERNLSSIRPFHIAVHEEVAEFYGIPSVDFAAGIYNMLRTGEVEWASLAPDGYHPNDAGHAIYAQFLRESLKELLLKSARNSISECHVFLPLQPLITGNYEYGAIHHYELADYTEDFQIQQLDAEESLMNWRYSADHMYSDNPVASFVFTMEGQSGGLLLLCGPDTGIFEYSVNGEPFVQVNPFDEWCLHAYRPVTIILPIQNQRGQISITVRNTNLKDQRSRGTGLRVLKLLTS